MEEKINHQGSLLCNEINYLNFCFKIDIEFQFKEDYELIYKIGVLYDLYDISSIEIKYTIKKELDEEINKDLSGVIKRLLETAFIFANLNSDDYIKNLNLSSDEKEKKIEEIDKIRNKSYRIAISVYYYGKYLKEEIKENRKNDEDNFFDNNNVIYRLFTRLGILSTARNEKIEDVDIFSIDIQGKIEATNKEISNKFCIEDKLKNIFKNNEFENYFKKDFKGFKNDEIYFSDFQNGVIENLFEYKKKGGGTKGKSIAISAPTSAGKTFILKKYIIYKILENIISGLDINIVFIVPSKALINELKSDFIELFEDYNIKETCNIHTHISGSEFREKFLGKNNLFLFTQERLNFFYSDMEFSEEFKRFKIDLIVVDEAHKVGYGYRGTLLSYIVGKLIKYNNDIQVVLLAPLLSKLNKFKREFGLKEIDEKFSNFGLVAKNEIIISIIKKGEIYEMKYFLKIGIKELLLFKFEYKLEEYLENEKSFRGIQKMTVISRHFTSGNNQSIIFRFGAETVINQIQLLQNGLGSNKNINKTNLSNYLSDILPNDFGLSELLEKGISYHNGRLPISIKSSIENEFKDNKIKYLCANYTVLEGVNLPAKNIFMLKEDYDNNNLTNLDIKNLIGRSGRLNYNLNGNIFFINFKTKKDREKILTQNNTEKLENNFENILDTNIIEGEEQSKFDKFLEYIKPGSTKYKDSIDLNSYNEKKDFEYMLGYLVSKIIDKTIDEPKLINNFEITTFQTIISERFKDIRTKKSKNDIFSKIGELIYENKEIKEEKIDELRNSILSICNNELNIKSNGDKDFLQIVKKNIFIDPRKQLDFYESVIKGEDGFIKDNILEYSRAIKLLSDSTVLREEKIEGKEKEFIKKIEKKSENIKNILKQSQKYFIQKYISDDGVEYFQGEKNNWRGTYIFQVLEKWFFSKSLIQILGNKKEFYLSYLKTINDDIQFHYLNAFSIYFELSNLGYKRYLEENKQDLYEEYSESNNFPQLDTNFIYYMELGTFYPNLVYLVSKGVSRESAIWLKNNINIKLFPPVEGGEKQYFDDNKEKILKILKDNDKIIVFDELEKFIY